MIQNILVLGAGSAGLIAALSFKRKIPQLQVRVIRSPEIGIIGVGEGTTPNFPRHMFEYLGLSPRKFYELAEPTWKIGIRFLWGPRGRFDYTFSQQMDHQRHDLPRPNGYYCDDDFSSVDIPSALMREDKVFARQADGSPDIQPWHAFHIENKKFVEVLELAAKGVGVEIIDGRMVSAERNENGIAAITLEDGRRFESDLFIDASGFRSELLGKALETPYDSYDKSLFCDRAVVGGWERTDEPILPYTTAETMEAGWSWQIEHEHHVNRGYVYSSQAISDDQAAAEFLAKNPKAPQSPRIVKFRSGRYRSGWVGNVVGIGNAAGFVEPLEATALMVVCAETRTLVDMLLNCALQPTRTIRKVFNERVEVMWDDIRDFLALHYKLNTRLNNPFWRHCQEDTDVSGIADLLEFYSENGPSGFSRYTLRSHDSNFGLEGYLVMLVGNRYPYQAKHTPTPQEWRVWQAHREVNRGKACMGLNVAEALSYIRRPEWRWNTEVQQSQSTAAR